MLFLLLAYPISIDGVIFMDVLRLIDGLGVQVGLGLQSLLDGVELRPLVFAETAHYLHFHIITVKNYHI